MVNRRNFLKSTGAVGAAGLAGLSGCTGENSTGESGDGGDGSATTAEGTMASDGTTASEGTKTGSSSDSKQSIMFALTPSESDVDIEKQYQPLFKYLESEANVTVESTVAADYAAVLQALKSGQADIADAAPALAIQGAKEGVTKVVGIRVAYGASRYFSLITTTPDSGIEKLEDLKGETIALADRLSTSGAFFPLYMLKQAGLDTGNAPDGEAKDFSAQYSDHATARETLVNRAEVKAAGTGAFSTAPHVPKDQFPKQFLDMSAENDGDLGTEKPKLNLLSVSDPIPRAPILARADMDQQVYSNVESALLNVEEDDLVNEDLKEDQQLWFSGVDKGSAEDYDPVKKVINELGVTLGQ